MRNVDFETRIEDRLPHLSAEDHAKVLGFVDMLLFADPAVQVLDAWGNEVEQTPQLRAQILNPTVSVILGRVDS